MLTLLTACRKLLGQAAVCELCSALEGVLHALSQHAVTSVPYIRISVWRVCQGLPS